MIEINLIPDVKQELLRAQRQRSMVISASIITSIVAVGVVVLMLFYIFAVQGGRTLLLDKDITKKSDELSKVEDLSKILTIQNQLNTIGTLNDSKLMTSRLFDVMAAITPTGEAAVTYSQISLTPLAGDASGEGSATGGGQIMLEGQTSNYETMESFKKHIDNTSFEYVNDEGEKELIKLAANISTADASYGEDSSGKRVLRFMITFDYPAELFSPATAKKEISYKLTVNGNVTDSYLGIPRFDQRASDLKGGE